MKHQGVSFAIAAVFCFAAHLYGWAGVGALLFGIGAGLRVRQWLRGPFEQPKPGMDREQAEKLARDLGAKLAEHVAAVANARVVTIPKDAGKGH